VYLISSTVVNKHACNAVEDRSDPVTESRNSSHSNKEHAQDRGLLQKGIHDLYSVITISYTERRFSAPTSPPLVAYS